MPMILPLFAVIITLMVGTMSGGIINISFDIILHHPNQINIAQAGVAIILFFCNMGAIVTLMGHAVSEVSKIPSTAKCIGNRLPLKQTLYILSLTIITLSIMTYTTATNAPNNTNTIPLMVMFTELYCILTWPAAQQITNFKPNTTNIRKKQAIA